MILLEEAVKDLDAGGGVHGPALHLTVGMEAVVQRDLVPAVGGRRRLVDLDVDFAQSVDVLIAMDAGSFMRL